jgi:hypothetical protein
VFIFVALIRNGSLLGFKGKMELTKTLVRETLYFFFKVTLVRFHTTLPLLLSALPGRFQSLLPMYYLTSHFFLLVEEARDDRLAFHSLTVRLGNLASHFDDIVQAFLNLVLRVPIFVIDCMSELCWP